MASKSLSQDKERPKGPLKNQSDHTITDDHLNVIATLVKEWTLLIPFLELSEQDVRDVASSSQDPTTRAVNALLRWKRRSGAQATYANLVDVFVRSSNTELAARVTELAKHKPSKGAIADRKPLLQELATIPTDHWHDMGLCLSLSTEELDQIASKVPARRRKREMFRTWLNQARNPTWRDVVEALAKVDPPTARSVKEEFEIDIPAAPAAPSGDRQRVGEDEDRPDSGVESPEEDGVLSPSKERSPVSLSRVLSRLQSSLEALEDVLRSQRADFVTFVAQELHRKGLLKGSALPVDRGAVKPTLLIHGVKAALTMEPQIFQKALEVLQEAGKSWAPGAKHQEVPDLALRVEDVAKVYEILLERQRISPDHLELDSLARALFKGGLVTQSACEECFSRSEDLEKAVVLAGPLVHRGASRAFSLTLKSFPNTRPLAQELERLGAFADSLSRPQGGREQESPETEGKVASPPTPVSAPAVKPKHSGSGLINTGHDGPTPGPESRLRVDHKPDGVKECFTQIPKRRIEVDCAEVPRRQKATGGLRVSRSESADELGESQGRVAEDCGDVGRESPKHSRNKAVEESEGRLPGQCESSQHVSTERASADITEVYSLPPLSSDRERLAPPSGQVSEERKSNELSKTLEPIARRSSPAACTCDQRCQVQPAEKKNERRRSTEPQTTHPLAPSAPAGKARAEILGTPVVGSSLKPSANPKKKVTETDGKVKREKEAPSGGRSRHRPATSEHAPQSGATASLTATVGQKTRSRTGILGVRRDENEKIGGTRLSSLSSQVASLPSLQGNPATGGPPPAGSTHPSGKFPRIPNSDSTSDEPLFTAHPPLKPGTSLHGPVRKVITDTHLKQIAAGISDWAFLIPFLDLSSSSIDEISTSDPSDRAEQALRQWKSQRGRRATYANLEAVFKRSSNATLVKKVAELAARKGSEDEPDRVPVKGDESTKGPLDKVVRKQHLTQIATGISDWAFLIPFLDLGLSATSDISRSDPSARAERALKCWRDQQGRQATYANLADIFQRSSNAALARRVIELAPPEDESGVEPSSLPSLSDSDSFHSAPEADESDGFSRSVSMVESPTCDMPESFKEEFLQAIKRDDEEKVEALLKSGKVSVEDVTLEGLSALMVAAVQGNVGVAQVLLKHGASVSATDQNGATPLYLSAREGNYQMCRLLIDKFADVNAPDKDGTPMLIAPASKGFSMVTELLLENSANPNLKNKVGVTPLLAATTKGQRDVVKVLLKHGADPHVMDPETSRTALQEAIHQEHEEIKNMLVQAEAKAAEKSRQMFTCKTDEDVRALVNRGAKVDERRGDGATPLIVHTEAGNRKVVQELINHDANVDLQDEHGMTAVMKASQRGDLELVQMIVKARAILDLKSKKSWTALMYAVSGSRPKVVKELLLAGADPTDKDKNGKTAVDLAQEVGNSEIITLLEKQSGLTDTHDPFLPLLSNYLDTARASVDRTFSLGPSPPQSLSPRPTRKLTSEKPKFAARRRNSLLSIAKPAEEANTLKEELSKSYRRIADLETRIHDLSLQVTMEIPEDADLSYFERSRLEAEYRKLKEVKRKAEQYAIEAKQTAQRLSAENFKLKEDLSRERHHNELTRKSMLREMEQKVLKNESMVDRAEAKLEAFDKELTQHALELTQRAPQRAMEFVRERDYSPSEIRDIILKGTIHANMLQVGITGLPFSGKSTLLRSLLNLKSHEAEAEAANKLPGLACYEIMLLKDVIDGQYTWGCNSTKINVEVLGIAAALAQACMQGNHHPCFTSSLPANQPMFDDPVIDTHFRNILASLKHLVNSLKLNDQLYKLSSSMLTFVTIWDVGMNKAAYEFLSALASHHRRLLLVNVLHLQRDVEHLHESPKLDDPSLYHHRYQERGDEKMVMQLQTSLYYYGQFVAAAGKAWQDPSNVALLVGSHADLLTEDQRKANQIKVLRSLKTAMEDVSTVIFPELLAITAESKKDVERIKRVLESMINQDRRFEKDIPVSWIFLRCILHHMNKLYMHRRNLLTIAKKCGLAATAEVDDWLSLFQSCGSIIYIASETPSPQDYVILDPIAFAKGLDQLYYLDKDSDQKPDIVCHLETAQKGLITRELAVSLWSEDAECYLDALQKLSIIAQVDGLVSDDAFSVFGRPTSCYFMPTLRPGVCPDKISVTTESLIFQFAMEVPFHVQSVVLEQFLTELHETVEFVPSNCYNQLEFQWRDEEIAAKINLRFTETTCEVSFLPQSGDNLRLCSVLKSTCISVFSNVLPPAESFSLALVCPNETPEDTSTRFVRIHALQRSSDVYCSTCRQAVSMTGLRRDWIRAGYTGPVGLVLGHADIVTDAELLAIVEHFTHWNTDSLALALGLTRSEMATLPSNPKDRLTLILNEWKRRCTYGARRVLAKALSDCGEYRLAFKIDATFIDHPPQLAVLLTVNELAAVSAHMQEWMSIGTQLQLSDQELVGIKRSFRTNADQCFHMLFTWAKMNRGSVTNQRTQLVQVLQSAGYEQVARFLQTGDSTQLLL